MLTGLLAFIVLPDWVVVVGPDAYSGVQRGGDKQSELRGGIQTRDDVTVTGPSLTGECHCVCVWRGCIYTRR